MLPGQSKYASLHNIFRTEYDFCGVDEVRVQLSWKEKKLEIYYDTD